MNHIISLLILLSLTSCSPTFKVASPEKPIEINLNVKIEHEVKVKVDKDLDKLFKKSKDIF
jgi:hypothetical protein